MALCGGLYASGTGEKPVGYIMILALFMFNICTGLFGKSLYPAQICEIQVNAYLVNALHNMYPNEVLHYSQRAKGMGMYSFF